MPSSEVLSQTCWLRMARTRPIGRVLPMETNKVCKNLVIRTTKGKCERFSEEASFSSYARLNCG